MRNLMKQQVTTVTSSWECVDEQRSQAPSDVQNITIQKTPAKRQKVGRRSNSPTCVSWTSPSEVKGKKEARVYMRELIQSENMDRHGQTRILPTYTGV